MINAAIIQNRKLNTIAIAVLKIIGQVWCGPDVQDAHTTAVIEHTNYVSFSRRHRVVAVGFEFISSQQDGCGSDHPPSSSRSSRVASVDARPRGFVAPRAYRASRYRQAVVSQVQRTGDASSVP